MKRQSSHISIEDVRGRLADLIARYAPKDGESSTIIPGLFVTSRTQAGECKADHQPCLIVFAQGKKIVRLGSRAYACDHRSFLLTSVELPLGGQIVHASEDMPMLQTRLLLDMAVVREVLAEARFSPTQLRSRGLAIAVGESTRELLDACSRYLGLLEEPDEIPFLGKVIMREIIFRVLRSTQGARLRSIATTDDLGNRVTRAIAWLKAHYASPIQMTELAAVAAMSVSSLNHQFRSLTGMSPLQFQKQLRLRAAQDRMLLEGADASTAAFSVGYESVSQFNREYRRLFGKPPMRDVKAIRERSRADF